MKNLRVAVLRGGPSQEYEVSLKTGRGVLDSLGRRDVSTIDILINKQGEWILNGFARRPEEVLAGVEVVFVALHGSYGEDGTVQRILERVGVPYTGSRSYPSAVAMNKILTKEILRSGRLKMPAHMRVSAQGTDMRRVAATIESLFGPSYVVKPISGGSSIDTVIANGVHELIRALQTLLATHEDVMVEEFISGREATVGIVEGLRGQSHYVLPAIEIVPPNAHGFFDYEAKYNGQTEEICPGRFSLDEKTSLAEAALQAHNLLGLSQYSRSDFIIGKKGDIYFLETNSLPGLTE
ncbi:MAG: ATP-grasp domain-containing protein, partial [Candidatus Paceibacterota bacterium]